MELWPPVPKGTQEAFPGGRCPRCTAPRVHRSRTTSSVARLLRILSPLRAFRCSACDWRGFRRPVAGEGPEETLPPLSGEASRRRGRANKDHAHVSLSRLRRLMQVLLTVLLAALAGGLVARFQGG